MIQRAYKTTSKLCTYEEGGDALVEADPQVPKQHGNWTLVSTNVDSSSEGFLLVWTWVRE